MALVSYSVSSKEVYRTLARYIDKILKGAKPADLPVEEPRSTSRDQSEDRQGARHRHPQSIRSADEVIR